MKQKSKQHIFKEKPIYILYIKPGKTGFRLKYIDHLADMFHYFHGWTDEYQPNDTVKFIYHDMPMWYGGGEQYNFSYDGYDFYGPVGIIKLNGKKYTTMDKETAEFWKKELCRYNNKQRLGKTFPISTPTGNIHETVYDLPDKDAELLDKLIFESVDSDEW